MEFAACISVSGLVSTLEAALGHSSKAMVDVPELDPWSFEAVLGCKDSVDMEAGDLFGEAGVANGDGCVTYGLSAGSSTDVNNLTAAAPWPVGESSSSSYGGKL